MFFSLSITFYFCFYFVQFRKLPLFVGTHLNASNSLSHLLLSNKKTARIGRLMVFFMLFFSDPLLLLIANHLKSMTDNLHNSSLTTLVYSNHKGIFSYIHYTRYSPQFFSFSPAIPRIKKSLEGLFAASDSFLHNY